MRALGMIELVSIPRGIKVADEMLKAANVALVSATAVCAGKYIVIVSGDVAAVKSSVESGEIIADEKIVDSMVIANVHDGVIGALTASSDVEDIKALGIIETFSLCAAVLASDAMVKAANVQLIEVRLGRGLGGKSFITLTGEISAVESAVAVMDELEEVKGLVSGCEVIASPHPDLFEAIY
jgi:microcompartment protein CcmL/EutN